MPTSKRQRKANLAKANAVRFGRAAIVRRVYNGRMELAEALRHPHMQSATLFYVAARLPFGQAGNRTMKELDMYIRPRYDRADQFCRRCGINSLRLVGELTPRQVGVVLEEWDATPVEKPRRLRPRGVGRYVGVAAGGAPAPTRARPGDSPELQYG